MSWNLALFLCLIVYKAWFLPPASLYSIIDRSIILLATIKSAESYPFNNLTLVFYVLTETRCKQWAARFQCFYVRRQAIISAEKLINRISLYVIRSLIDQRNWPSTNFTKLTYHLLWRNLWIQSHIRFLVRTENTGTQCFLKPVFRIWLVLFGIN